MTANEADEGQVRLQLFLARAGLASRRAAEGMIRDGRVAVNGRIVREMGSRCGPADVVTLDGNLVSLQETLRYVMLNKPPGYLCAAKDDFGRALALDLVQPSYPERLFSVGRLDFESSGLLLFTNDGEFARTLSHPSSGLEKEYQVKAHTRIPMELARAFQAGIPIEGEIYRAKRCVHLADDEMSVVLVEGKNREIRKVFGEFGLRILSLRRIRLDGLVLGGLAEGTFKDLTEGERQGLLGARARGGRGR